MLSSPGPVICRHADHGETWAPAHDLSVERGSQLRGCRCLIVGWRGSGTRRWAKRWRLHWTGRWGWAQDRGLAVARRLRHAWDGTRNRHLEPRLLGADDLRVDLEHRGTDVVWLAEEPETPVEIEARDSDLVDATQPSVAGCTRSVSSCSVIDQTRRAQCPRRLKCLCPQAVHIAVDSPWINVSDGG
jgi:hypothetical protein